MQEYLNLFVVGRAGVLAGLCAPAGYYAATHQNRLTASSFVADWMRDLFIISCPESNRFHSLFAASHSCVFCPERSGCDNWVAIRQNEQVFIPSDEIVYT